MKLIGFASMNGGTGKSSLLIMTANCLAAAGFHVLVIDITLNKSVSFYYLNSETEKAVEYKNIDLALSKPDNKLDDYILLTDKFYVDIIPAPFDSVELRNLPLQHLTGMLAELKGQYDFVFIDMQSGYDGSALSLYNASDLIIRPVRPCFFDFAAESFFHDITETDIRHVSCRLCINGYSAGEKRNEADDASIAEKEYIERFCKSFQTVLSSAFVPFTSAVRAITDTNRNMFLRENGSTKIKDGIVVQSELFNVVYNLAQTIHGGHFNKPEEF